MRYKRKKHILKKHALNFINRIRREYSILSGSNHAPNLHFFKNHGNLKNKMLQELTESPEVIEGAQNGNIIHVYNLEGQNMEQLKRVTRHECLHFLLYAAGLPCDDENETFILLSMLYDANTEGRLLNKITRQRLTNATNRTTAQKTK